MNRRDIGFQSLGVVLAALGTSAMAQSKPAKAAPAAAAHQHHHHGPSMDGLIAAASDCVVKGQSCLAHCLTLLGDGDKAMAACAKTVNQTLAVCSALQALATQQSTLLPAMAKLALDACQICEKECRKHEKHAECRACAEACVVCADQCKAALG